MDESATPRASQGQFPPFQHMYRLPLPSYYSPYFPSQTSAPLGSSALIYDLPALPTPLRHRQTSPHHRTSAPRQSSPISSDMNPKEVLELYIEWHSKRALGYATQWEEAREILIENSFDLDGICTSTESELMEMGIKKGIAKTLKRDIRKFNLERKRV